LVVLKVDENKFKQNLFQLTTLSTSIEAPDKHNTLTISVRPSLAATCKGVSEFASLISTLQPFVMRRSAISVCPLLIAK
jgi:hypothetical protein